LREDEDLAAASLLARQTASGAISPPKIAPPILISFIRTYVQEHHGVDVRFAAGSAGGHDYDFAGQFETSAVTDAAVRPSLVPR
jgi:hypothetical protein